MHLSIRYYSCYTDMECIYCIGSSTVCLSAVEAVFYMAGAAAVYLKTSPVVTADAVFDTRPMA